MEQRAFLDEARALLTEGETALAIDLFTRAIANGESPVEARLERARAHLAMGQLPQAIEDLGRAIKLDPKKADAYYHLGVARLAAKTWPAPSRPTEAPLESSPITLRPMPTGPGSWEDRER